MEEQTSVSETGDAPSQAHPEQPKRSWFWFGRRVMGLSAPVVVAALATLVYLMFTVINAEDTASLDYAILYALVLLSPMGLSALMGFLCAVSSRGRPAPKLGRLSFKINLVLTALLIVPALIMLPLFLRIAPAMIPDLMSVMRQVRQD